MSASLDDLSSSLLAQICLNIWLDGYIDTHLCFTTLYVIPNVINTACCLTHCQYNWTTVLWY